jgi:hypothetical protein
VSMKTMCLKMPKRLVGVFLSFWIAACSSIGPGTMSRDRVDYVNAIGNSWERQTLLNIIKLRYGHAPIFLSITQVVTGYQFQSTVGAGVTPSNFTPVSNLFGLEGSVTAQGQYTDRPTVIYTPLTGMDFLQQLMTPIPPSAVLFVLGASYNAEAMMSIALDSINGIYNRSNRMGHAADPRFNRLSRLICELQLAEALQVRVERNKHGTETSLITFAPSKEPQVEAEKQEVRSLLGLRPGLQRFEVRYGGYSGRDDEISMMTRSMLQVLLDLAADVQVPQSDVSEQRADPGLVEGQVARPQTAPAVNILTGNREPPEASISVQYNGRWFWIADTDIRSKNMFGSVMLLFSISDIGSKGKGPIVTVPANG